MFLVNSASADDRNVGQVRVLGLRRQMSSTERLKARRGSARFPTLVAKNTKCAEFAPLPNVRRANLVRLSTDGNSPSTILEIVQAKQPPCSPLPQKKPWSCRQLRCLWARLVLHVAVVPATATEGFGKQCVGVHIPYRCQGNRPQPRMNWPAASASRFVSSKTRCRARSVASPFAKAAIRERRAAAFGALAMAALRAAKNSCS